MSVHLQADASNACAQRITVLGRPLSEASCEELLALLAPTTSGKKEQKEEDEKEEGEAATPTALKLVFYDADTLPAPLIEAICAALDAGRKVKVLAYHGLLAQRLGHLGIPVRQAARVKPRRPGEEGQTVTVRAFALAGSAHSLDKLMTIVGALPRSEASIFVAQHVGPEQINLLDQLLKTRTDCTVLMPQQLCPIEPGTIYVAPPGHHMKVAHGQIYLTRDRAVQFARPSIDVLFESVAAEYGDSALAVLLCGFGSDGVQGCAAMKRSGSLVFAEAGDDCGEARAMPDAVRDAGHCDQSLPLPALASIVAAIASGEQDLPTPALIPLFLEALHAHCGQDLRGYQADSLMRRIRALMGQLGLPRFSDFQRALFSESQVFERFTAELPVGVTSFFRHAEQLRELREEVLPFLQSFAVVKLWCAGCSSGEEAYSLAIMLEEAGLAARSHLFATDMNAHALALACDGLYPIAALRDAERDYQAAGGTRTLADYLEPRGRIARMVRRLSEHVLFYRHSLSDEGVFNEFQLIVCRNVLIYFSAELQAQVLQRFTQSLHPDGLLVLGPHDGMNMIARDCGFVPLRAGGHVYKMSGRTT
ncbi:MAG TPA: chemotaxis protein CheB [Burkholderiaceae bacterium]|jgi:chemotaxis protein methyltransferase CheR